MKRVVGEYIEEVTGEDLMVSDSEAILPKDGESLFFSLHPVIVLATIPFVGLIYILFLPVFLVGTIVVMAGSKLVLGW